jgi:hypothetical protein
MRASGRSSSGRDGHIDRSERAESERLLPGERRYDATVSSDVPNVLDIRIPIATWSCCQAARSVRRATCFPTPASAGSLSARHTSIVALPQGVELTSARGMS